MCHASYIKKYEKNSRNADTYSNALNDLFEHTNPLLEVARALNLNEIFLVYQELLRKYAPELSVLAYTTQKLGEKLKKLCKGKIINQSQNKGSKRSIVYGSDISIFDVVNSARACKEMQTIFINEPITDETKKQIKVNDRVLYYPALIIKNS